MPSVHPPFLRSCCWYCGAVWTCMLIFSGVSAQETVSLDFLLHEMLDRESVLKAPEEFTCRQFSSFDRRAGSPEENWFANGDTAQFLRTEERNGKTEWVLMDVQGPGAVVRWWITAPQYRNRLFVYVDGEKHQAEFTGDGNNYSLELNLENGYHEICVTQVIDGVESERNAARTILV